MSFFTVRKRYAPSGLGTLTEPRGACESNTNTQLAGALFVFRWMRDELGDGALIKKPPCVALQPRNAFTAQTFDLLLQTTPPSTFYTDPYFRDFISDPHPRTQLHLYAVNASPHHTSSSSSPHIHKRRNKEHTLLLLSVKWFSFLFPQTLEQ